VRSKDEVRKDIWKAMDREGISRFPGAEGRIPNFAGAGLSTTGIQGAAFVSQSNTGVDLAPGYPSQTSVRVQTNRANGTAVSTSFTIAVFC